MANPFDGEDGDIIEGFLCPICRQDLKTPERLTQHVEKEHAEEQDLLKSLKDIFSKAKKKIKFNFDETVDLAKFLDSSLKTNYSYKENISIIESMAQDVGVERTYFDYFKDIRTPRLERYASETNKLIIRLNKLLRDRPTDAAQQKLHEQKLVPWLDGKSVNLCPNCAKSFHLARRQHHCRLCGSVMCADCSRFLNIDNAMELIDPANKPAADSDKKEGKEKESNTLRLCEHCLRLLENRKEMQDSRTYQPPITVYYAKIKELQKEMESEIPVYSKMINSLYGGDSLFTIADAGALRSKIVHIAEGIENISKAILSLPCPQGSREEALKKSLRIACMNYIKAELPSIPPLPVEEEIRKLQEKRRMESEQQIERDRRLILEAYERYGFDGTSTNVRHIDQSSNGSFASASAVTTLDNWSGQQSCARSLNDPLIEQINIIKGYIKQARAALRFDEVATLELNLRELQQELYQRHQNE